MLFFKKTSPNLDPVRFATSWILPPVVLFAIRAVISLFLFTSIFTTLVLLSIGKDPAKARHYFSYFTGLTYFGLAFYFLFAALHTGSYWLTGTPFLARWPNILQKLHSIHYSIITTYPFLVTIVYWALIWDSTFPSKFDRYRNISEHILNSVFALFEIFVPRTLPTPKSHVVAIALVLALYLGLAYVTLATKHFYVYSFLDTRKRSFGIVVVYIIGILLGAIAVFFLVHCLMLLRKWVTETKMRKNGKFSSRTGRVRSVDEAEVIHVYQEK